MTYKIEATKDGKIIKTEYTEGKYSDAEKVMIKFSKEGFHANIKDVIEKDRKMELKFIGHNEVFKSNVKYQRDSYTIGNYNVARDTKTYEDGKTYEQFEISANCEKRFIPTIYFHQSFFDGEEKEFKIQTTSYGSLSPAEIQEVINGYQEALEVVNILTDKFLK